MNFLRRRKFVLNKNLQYSMLLISISYAASIFIVLAASLFVPLMVGMNRAEFASKESFQAANTILFIHKHFWIPGLLCMITIGIYSIRTSHRIAGPIYRLNKLLRSMKQGIIPRPLHNLRKSDYLTDEFELINQMLENLRSNLSDVQAEHSKLNNVISKHNKSANKASRDQLVKQLKKISDQSNKLGESIEYFKIES